MKGMRTYVMSWSICTGVILTGLISAIRAHAQKTISAPLGASKELAMYDVVTDAQKESVSKLLVEAMAILRDNKQFDPKSDVFGEIESFETKPGYPGGAYSFRNRWLPYSSVDFSTGAAPQDYSEDRMKVLVVPVYFRVLFLGALPEIDRISLERKLDLADYYIDRDGVKQPVSDWIPGPWFPSGLDIHRYRYRAKDHASTRVPVDVELDYIDPKKDAPSGKPVLASVEIRRAYETLTPEQRKQKREEKEQRARDLYGNPGAMK